MRVLVVRVGAMGDVLHALPAVAALRRARPEWEIGWVVDPRWAPLLANEGEQSGPVVDRVHLARDAGVEAGPDVDGTRRGRLRGFGGSCGRRGMTLCVDLQGTLRSAVIGWMAGAGRFVGPARAEGGGGAVDVWGAGGGAGKACGGAGFCTAGGGGLGVGLEARAGGAAGGCGGGGVVRPGDGGCGTVLLCGSYGWMGGEACGRRSGLGRWRGELVGAGYGVVVNAVGARRDAVAAAVVEASGGRARAVSSIGGADGGDGAESEPGDCGGYGAAAPGGGARAAGGRVVWADGSGAEWAVRDEGAGASERGQCDESQARGGDGGGAVGSGCGRGGEGGDGAVARVS